MKKIFKSIFFSLLLVFAASSLTGCGSSEPKPISSKPDWILNPNKDGKIGAVGVAGNTYDQRVSTKRKLAIQRALDELALQQGVKVQLNMRKEEHLRNNRSSTAVDSVSDYKTTNTNTITAHIEDVWQDKITGELYIWLVLDQ